MDQPTDRDPPQGESPPQRGVVVSGSLAVLVVGIQVIMIALARGQVIDSEGMQRYNDLKVAHARGEQPRMLLGDGSAHDNAFAEAMRKLGYESNPADADRDLVEIFEDSLSLETRERVRAATAVRRIELDRQHNPTLAPRGKASTGVPPLQQQMREIVAAGIRAACQRPVPRDSDDESKDAGDAAQR